jgi:tRNA 2-thiouridine synthesizing protein A
MNTDKTNADKTLDVCGLNCPLPILKTKKSLADMHSGQVLQVLTTDPGSVKDLDAFCRQTGHTLLSHEEVNGRHEFAIRCK